MAARTCVVISYWAGRSPKNLWLLLNQLQRVDAGAEFAVVVVVNGGDLAPLRLPSRYAGLRATVIHRQNVGYNIGAWNAGWLAFKENYQYFLFLQDECFIKRKGWVFDYEYRMTTDAKIGLLGESIMWDRMTWPFIKEDTDRTMGADWWARTHHSHPVLFYQDFIASRGIDVGEFGTHLQSLVLFARSDVLHEMGGFPVADSYHEAVGCEIAISRWVESRGYRISKVRNESFALIGHRQWTPASQFKSRWANRIRHLVKSAAAVARPRARLAN